MIVQLPLTVTFYPGSGILPSGHWVALLHWRTKVYFMNSPGGVGQRYLHSIATTSVVSKYVLVFALVQSYRVLLPAVLS